jgi:hypothetical protein
MYEGIILSFGIIIFLTSWFTPLPYGRFCNTIMVPKLIEIPNILLWSLCNIPVLLVLCYKMLIKHEKVNDLGLALFVFLCIHAFWRSIMSQILIYMIKSHKDEKKGSILVLILLGTYNVFVGLSWFRLCRHLNREMNWLDYPLLIGAILCMILNGFYDIYVNYERNNDVNAPYKETLGHYIKYEFLEAKFPLLFAVGITSPNYFFEICQWLFIALMTMHTESWAYFISTLLILWVRACSITLSQTSN